MKFVFTVLLALTICLGFAQTENIDYLKITNNSILEKGNLSQDIFIPIEKPDKKAKHITKKNIQTEFWDNINVNPYKNRDIEYPLHISFKDSNYVHPVLNKNSITSRYGWRHGRAHKGIDLDLVTGDSVVAVLDGIVRVSRYSRSLGHVIIIRHYNGLETTYAHLSKRYAKVNDSIKKGQFLGNGGNTGRSRGSHLHFEVSYKGQYIHPEYIFDFSDDSKIRAQNIWVTKEWTHASFHNARRKSKLKLFTTEEAALASLVKTRKVYVVKPGDTLSRISKKNRVSVNSICKVNSIRKSSMLKIGQKLILEL